MMIPSQSFFTPRLSWITLLLALASIAAPTTAFSPSIVRQSSSSTSLFGATVVEPPTREKTDRKTSDWNDEYDEEKDDFDYPDLEYLQDAMESREMDDPFHILLMGSTFEKPKITVKYVSGSLEYVLSMPLDEAKELSTFARDEGMSCLGTWPREECLSLGKQLQRRDIVCRVVPYAEGGQRGWQAKDAQDRYAGSSNGYNNNEGFY